MSLTNLEAVKKRLTTLSKIKVALPTITSKEISNESATIGSDQEASISITEDYLKGS